MATDNNCLSQQMRNIVKRLLGVECPKSEILSSIGSVEGHDWVLNVGSGSKIRNLKKCVNLDICWNDKLDIVADLNFSMPFRDGVFGGVLADNVIEHVSNIIPLMNEVFRVLKNGGRMEIWVPYFNSTWAIADPTHVRHFNEKSFIYFSKDFPDPKLKSSYGITCEFIIKKCKKYGIGRYRGLYVLLEKR